MRPHRQPRGQIGKRLEVERRHRDRNGAFKPFEQIAAEIYDEYPTREDTREQIRVRYGVAISGVTAGNWINQGLAARREALAAEGKAVAA